MSSKLGKKKWFIVIAIVIVVALVIGVVALSTSKSPQPEVSGTVDVITKRNIAISISGNGTVETATKEDVTGGFYGATVSSVKVAEGDMIYAGDVICVFDTSDYEEQIADYQQQIADVESERKTQNADYDQRIADSEESTAEQLETAKENLANAKVELEEEEAELEARQKAYDDYLAEDGHTKYDSEAINLQSLIDSQKEVVDSAQATVDYYQEQVNNLEEQDTSSLEDAKRNYNDQVDATVDRYEEQIDNLEDQIEDATVRAGISGTITALNVTEGSNFSGGTIASIEAVDTFIVEAQIDEYDIADIAVGMKVLIKTDATRDAELEGVITYVAARATDTGSSSLGGLSGLMGSGVSSMTSSSGSASYLVKIELKEQNDRLRLGMNAKVSIITEESVEAWSVPYDAVHVREDGTTYLEVITGEDEDGNYVTREMDVTVGIQGTYYIEVISPEITDGIQIWIPAAQGTSSLSDLLNMMGADAGI